MEQEIENIVEVDTILNNLYFRTEESKKSQFIKDVMTLNVEGKYQVLSYLISRRHQHEALIKEMLNKDKKAELINSIINDVPFVIYLSKENLKDIIQLVISHKDFDVRIFDNIEHLKLFVKENKKDEKILLTLIEKNPDITLVKNLKGFKFSDKVSNLLEATYLNQTISDSQKETNKKLKI
jgi:uncharacterized protein (DUF2164 family)